LWRRAAHTEPRHDLPLAAAKAVGPGLCADTRPDTKSPAFVNVMRNKCLENRVANSKLMIHILRFEIGGRLFYEGNLASTPRRQSISRGILLLTRTSNSALFVLLVSFEEVRSEGRNSNAV